MPSHKSSTLVDRAYYVINSFDDSLIPVANSPTNKKYTNQIDNNRLLFIVYQAESSRQQVTVISPLIYKDINLNSLTNWDVFVQNVL